MKLAMKAAGSSARQIKDRIDGFSRLAIDAALELYITLHDISQGAGNVRRNCAAYKDCEYLVHVPLSDAGTDYLFDIRSGESSIIEKSLDLCNAIGSHVLIAHRCYGFGCDISRRDCEARFFDEAAKFDKLAKNAGVRILYENYGFVWLPEGLGKEYVVSPLDHFFPWEIAEFIALAKKSGLKNTGVLVDIAHAAISSNMFNMLKSNRSLHEDARFAAIDKSDLEKTVVLKPKDFMIKDVDYFHVSDAFLWRPIDDIDMKKYLYTEGLRLGSGNLNFEEIFFDIKGDKTLVMEIVPEDGDHEKNSAQIEGVKRFAEMFGGSKQGKLAGGRR